MDSHSSRSRNTSSTDSGLLTYLGRRSPARRLRLGRRGDDHIDRGRRGHHHRRCNRHPDRRHPQRGHRAGHQPRSGVRQRPGRHPHQPAGLRLAGGGGRQQPAAPRPGHRLALARRQGVDLHPPLRSQVLQRRGLLGRRRGLHVRPSARSRRGLAGCRPLRQRRAPSRPSTPPTSSSRSRIPTRSFPATSPTTTRPSSPKRCRSRRPSGWAPAPSPSSRTRRKIGPSSRRTRATG